MQLMNQFSYFVNNHGHCCLNGKLFNSLNSVDWVSLIYNIIVSQLIVTERFFSPKRHYTSLNSAFNCSQTVQVRWRKFSNFEWFDDGNRTWISISNPISHSIAAEKSFLIACHVLNRETILLRSRGDNLTIFQLKTFIILRCQVKSHRLNLKRKHDVTGLDLNRWIRTATLQQSDNQICHHLRTHDS